MLTKCEPHRCAGAIILMMSHGYQIQDEGDPFVETVNEAMEQFAICTAPGAFLANIFPARKFLIFAFPLRGYARQSNVHELIAAMPR